MGEVADEIPAHRLKTASARQVLNQQKASTGMLIGNHDELQILVACRHLHRFALHLARLLAAPPGFHKLMVAHNFCDAVMKWIPKLKEPARSWVGKLDQPRGI